MLLKELSYKTICTLIFLIPRQSSNLVNFPTKKFNRKTTIFIF
ncbi:hypothetical protein X975_23217, partial [Stegodyphus mimosarum]